MSTVETEISPEEKELREKLAAEAGLNGNGNGHHSGAHQANGSAHQEPSSESSTEPGEKKFSMFDDIREDTEQDKARGSGSNQGGAGPKNPFEDMGPENDVKEDEIKEGENVTLKEANARVSLYITTLDFVVSFMCCGIRNDFSLASQLKYRIHAWRKKAIQVPWVRYVLIPKKRSHPAWSLAGAIFIGTLPVFGMAYMDKHHEKKMEDPEYQKKHGKKSGENRNDFERENAQHYRESSKRSGSTADTVDAEYVEFVEVRDEDQDLNGREPGPNGKSTRKGRHKESCPKHYDKDSEEPCNCK